MNVVSIYHYNTMDYLEYYKGKTVLVTGGAGAIGTNLVRALARADAKLVIILDNLTASYKFDHFTPQIIHTAEGNCIHSSPDRSRLPAEIEASRSTNGSSYSEARST